MSNVNNIQKLLDRKGHLWNEIEGLRDQVADGKFDASLEEKFERMNDEYKFIENQVRDLEAIEAKENDLAGQQGKNIANQNESLKTSKEIYKEAFAKYASGKSMTDVEASALSNYQNAAEQTITTTGGGYVIPEDFAGEVVKSMAYYGPFGVNPGAGPARIIRTSGGNPFPIPTINDTANTGQDLAINTDASTSSTALTFGTKQLDAHVITSDVIQVPKQLLQDEGVGFVGLLAELLGERMGRRYNNKVTRDVDAAANVGGFYDAATEGVVSAAIAAITANELIDLQHSVDPAYRNGPGVGFMMNDAIAASIRKLTVTANADQYLWEPNFTQGQPDRLLGDAVYINNDLPSTLAADNRSVFFGDWSKFWIRIVNGMELIRLDERYAEKYQIGWMGTMRFDAVLTDAAAIKFIRQLTT